MKYAFIFPGQGSQSIGMGKDLYDTFAIAKTYFEEANDVLDVNMQDLLFCENDKLNQTQWTQPAIFLVSFIAYKVFEAESNLKPMVALGHSLGEITAVAISGALSFANAISLTSKRGSLMAKVCDGLEAGMMVVMGLDDGALEAFCEAKRKSGKAVWCANYNGDGQIVLAGKKADLSAFESDLKTLGAKRALLLPMSVASHCPLLEPMKVVFSELLDTMLGDDFTIPIVSNATTQSYMSKAEAKALLTSQLVEPVRYKQSIHKINDSVDGFIEFGNGSVLKGLNKRLSPHPTFSISDKESLKQTLETLQNL